MVQTLDCRNLKLLVVKVWVCFLFWFGVLGVGFGYLGVGGMQPFVKEIWDIKAFAFLLIDVIKIQRSIFHMQDVHNL